MQKITLAIISDLHIGSSARSQDICPYPQTIQVNENYLEKFLDFVTKNNLAADYLIVPGDMTGRAHPTEFEMASEVILKIALKMGVSEEKILFVPGNHDKDWNVLAAGEEDTTGVRTAQMYQPLIHETWIFEKILQRSEYKMISDNCTAIWEYDDLVAIGYNSSWHDNRNHQVHHGLVKDTSLTWLDGKLSAVDLSADKLKIFIVHHHPIQYSDHIPDLPDFSVMTNAENLLKLLAKYKFDLLIHGHKHIPHFTTQIINSSFPLAILGAGSFSSKLEWSYNGHAANQFHLITVDERDHESESISGVLQSWAYYSGHHWQPSSKHAGIIHQIGFGTHTTKTALKKKLLPIIELSFTTSNYVKWLDLVDSDQTLKYVLPEVILPLLKEIGTLLNAEYFGDSPENAILLLNQ